MTLKLAAWLESSVGLLITLEPLSGLRGGVSDIRSFDTGIIVWGLSLVRLLGPGPLILPCTGDPAKQCSVAT